MIDEGNLVEISDQFNETPDYWRNDIDYDNESVSSVSTYNTVENKNKVKTRYGVSYKNDKSFFKIKGSKKGIPSITGYSTNLCPGSTIRNAVTGLLESDYMGKSIYKVGSLDEDLFFKVSMSVNGISDEPKKLFYDSPEQYERHFHTFVSVKIKTAWKTKYEERMNFIENTKKQSEYYND